MQFTFLDVASWIRDANTIAAWAQVGAILVAIITLIFTLWSQTRLARFAATADQIWKFDDLWHTAEFRSLRVAAVAALRTQDGMAPEVIDIWNFFEMLGLMTHKKALDKYVVGNKFASKIVNYWYLSESRIKNRRSKDRSLWVEFEWLKDSIEEMQARQTHPRLSFLLRGGVVWIKRPDRPTQDALDKFITNESSLKIPGTEGGFWQRAYRHFIERLTKP